MLLAILSSLIYAAMAVIDKRLIDRYMPSMGSYYVWVGIGVLVYGVAFLFVEGVPDFSAGRHVAVAGISGLAWGGAVAMMFLGFKLQEVSRASAMVFTFPAFVAIFAVTFLGESLELLQWGAICIVVIGATGITMTGSATTGWTKLTKILPGLLTASLLTAVGHLTAKYALEELSVWLVTSLHFLGMAVVLLVFVRRNTVKQLRQAMQHKEAVMLLVLTEVFMAPLAILLLIGATKLGPVSLVATVTATRPIFVFVLSVALSMPGLRLINESVNRKTLVVKFASVSMIVGGVAAI